MIGLKRGSVRLLPHDPEWEAEAARSISLLRKILKETAIDIRHVGSTAVKSISAKPIIDIAVLTGSFESVLKHEDELKAVGFYYRPQSRPEEQLLFAAGSYYDGTGDEQTHFIHIVYEEDFRNYVNFVNYLNKYPSEANKYERLKLSLAAESIGDDAREKYTDGKMEFIARTLTSAAADSFLGKTVTVKIDRPVGCVHKKEGYSLTYPLNYGYIPGVKGGDGEELDVYCLGVREPLDEFTGKIVGVVFREDDIEDKLVAAPKKMSFTREDIIAAVRFQEQYYTTRTVSL